MAVYLRGRITIIESENMASNHERDCIVKARDAKLVVAKNGLDKLERDGLRFDGPASGISISRKNFVGGIKYFLLLPMVLVLTLFLFIMTPFAYVSHLREVSKKKQKIKDEIKKLESLSTKVPDEKVLLCLWELHGMDERKYSFDERINLLAVWIEILYGSKVQEKLNLHATVVEIAKRHGRLNKPYYDGDKMAAHFFCRNPVDVLIRKISDDLPAYEKASNRRGQGACNI